MNWDRVEIGGFFAGRGMTFGVVDRERSNLDRNKIGEGDTSQMA